MTYQREAGTWPAIVTAIVHHVGEARCAAACEVSRSRLQQLKNPMRADWRTLDLALRLDRLAHEAGLGTPIADEMRRRLGPVGAAGASPPVPAALRAAVAAAVAGLRRIADALAAAVEPSAVRKVAA